MSATDPADPADQPLDAVDGAVLAGVRELYAALDPVPEAMGERVKFALTVQALEAEIAELQRLPVESMAVRSVDYARAETITFTSDHLTAMVTITGVDADTVRIDGWVTGGPVEVELRERTRSSSVEADEDGRFVFVTVGRGMVQFVIRPTGGSGHRPVITPSLEV